MRLLHSLFTVFKRFCGIYFYWDKNELKPSTRMNQAEGQCPDKLMFYSSEIWKFAIYIYIFLNVQAIITFLSLPIEHPPSPQGKMNWDVKHLVETELGRCGLCQWVPTR